MDTEHRLIRDIETTTASIHDSQVDLSNPGEVVYRDKGYFGVEPMGYDATMKRAVRGKLLTIRDKLRNVAYSVSNSCLHSKQDKRISRKRAPGERPFAVAKNIFKAAHVMVTTTTRVGVKMIFTAFAFDLYHLSTIRHREAA